MWVTIGDCKWLGQAAATGLRLQARRPHHSRRRYALPSFHQRLCSLPILDRGYLLVSPESLAHSGSQNSECCISSRRGTKSNGEQIGAG